MSDNSAELAKMMGQIAGGDEQAFAAFYRSTRRLVFQVVQRQLVDEAQSEEVTQEVFLDTWVQAARFNSERGNVIPWLMTAARRRAIDRVRSSQASRVRDNREGSRLLAASHDDVAEIVELRVERERIVKALKHLTALQREAVVITYLEGHSIVDAARAVGASETAMKARVHDGLIGLRTLLAA